MTYSSRTNWPREHNRLTELLDSLRRENRPVYDLTVSNPTQCGIQYPKEILSGLATPSSLTYEPDPRGLDSARTAVARYYAAHNLTIDVSRIFLTSSTSEAYSYVFKLLCNAGDSVLIPNPSYPLFEYLAQTSDVDLQHYHLAYDHGWQVDFDSIKKSITPSTRAIALINPHNPTGMFIKKDEYARIREIAHQHRLALIVDEVFIDYAFGEDANGHGTTAGETDVLTFTLNGISKTIGLPQLKLGWIVVGGNNEEANEAMSRLEILCDTYLSVNTPVQVALPDLLERGKSVRRQILDRTRSNYEFLRGASRQSACTTLESEGGWYASLRLPTIQSDEQWAEELLHHLGVSLFPGYFFDFHDDAHLVVSLLTPPAVFQPSITRVLHHVSMR